MKTDVAVIGGGPAGTAAALTLLRYTKHKVVVVEGTNYELPRAGETVSAAVKPLLDYLDVWPRIQAEHKLESYASQAAWGAPALVTHDFIFTGGGNGWHLDRSAFDAALAKQVEQTGGKLLTRSWLRYAKYLDQRWELQLSGDQGAVTLLARQVIDASGRRSAFGQRMGARRKIYDQLVGVLAYFEMSSPADMVHSVLVESTPSGWWYSAPLPCQRMVVSFMTDADQLRLHRMHEQNIFLQQLAATAYVKNRALGQNISFGPRIFPAVTQQLEPLIGPAWVAVGDAAAAFDPLSSLGIGHALASGIQGARIVDQRIHGSEELALAFRTDVEQHLNAFRIQHQRLYGMERRWPGMPFWERRHPPRLH